MRVLPLTHAAEEKVLASRRASSRDAERIASRIVADVRRRGDAALFSWTKRFDRVALTPRTVWVSPAELASARKSISKAFLDAIEHAARNIRAVAQRQKPQEWTIEVEPGVRAGQRVRAIDSVGCYLPGGRFSLVSTLLMTVIPAQEAGVRRIVVASPQPGPALLAAAKALGVNAVARVGGAQAIAALAYGTRSIPRVDKIFGPGNRFVTAAKAHREQRLRDRHARRPHRSARLRHARQREIYRCGPDRAGGARSRRDFAVRHHVVAPGSRSRPRNRAAACGAAEDESGAALARKKWRRIRRSQYRGGRAIRESFRARALEPSRRRRRPARAHRFRRQRFPRRLERAIFRRLRERDESRAADGRRGAHARRAFRHRFREVHQRAGSLPQGRCNDSRPLSRNSRARKAWPRTSARSRCANENVTRTNDPGAARGRTDATVSSAARRPHRKTAPRFQRESHGLLAGCASRARASRRSDDFVLSRAGNGAPQGRATFRRAPR